VHAAELDVLERDAARRELHRRHVAQQLLHRALDQRRIGLQPGELLGMLEEHERADADHVGRRVVAGAQDHRADVRELVAAERAGNDVFRDHAAQHVVGGLALLGVDQRAAIGDEVARGARRLLGRLPQAVAARRAFHDVGMVLVGRAEELAHHQRGQRHGEVRDEVGGRALALHAVEEFGGDRLDARAQRHHPLVRELAREHAPEMLVARVVHADEGALGLVDGDARLGDRGEVGPRELAAEAAVLQDGAELGEPREQPGALAVPEPHRRDRALAPRLGVLRGRVEGIGAREGEDGERVDVVAVVLAHGLTSLR
jgi:hypothetical protein